MRFHFIFFLAVFFGLASCQFEPSNEIKSDSFWNQQPQIPLLDFENTELSHSFTSKNATVKLVTNQGVTQGKQALKIELQKDEKFSGIIWQPETPVDASELNDFSLVFDATNGGDFSTHLYVIVENENGEQRKRSASIPVGTTKTYFFELEEKYLREGNDTNLRDNPNPWKKQSTSVQMKMRGRIAPTDFSNISSIQFFIKNTLRDKEVILDHIRLVEHPPLPEDYLVGVVDKFGQNAFFDFAGKIDSEATLKKLADEELHQLKTEGKMPGRSQYGGWAVGPKLAATGFFRAEKVEDKWALVDPEGHLFFSSGIANVRMANTTTFTGRDFKNDKVRYRDPEDVTPEDSRGMVDLGAEVTRTAYVAYPERHQMFLELPSYDDPLANHFSYRREQHFGPFAHGETFSFYQANLERRYGEPTPGAHLKKWVDVTQDRFLNWGFTSFGNWTGYEFYHENRMPYFANGWIIGDFKTVRSGFDFWGEMPDVFDPEFARRAEVTVKVVAEEVKNNPWCVGVFIDNEKSWGVPESPKEQYGIVLDALSRSAKDSPVKAEFSKILESKYKTIQALNATWKTPIESWATFRVGVDFKNQKAYEESMVEDFSMLLEVYATKYFQVVHDALAAEMPNHMYLGCRFAPWGMGKEVLRAAGKYVDVFSYNYYEEGVGQQYWKFLEEIDRPCILGEFHIGTAASGLFHHGVIHAADHEDRARMYQDYLYSVIDNPYFVGAHWFQYLDSPVSGRAHDGENYNVGFVTVTDVPYPTMVRAAKEVHRKLYERRFGFLGNE
ncbi:MAG: agarase [Bacteroidota bacterium]